MELTKTMQAKSRRLCQDQLAWFRDDPLFHWVDADQPVQVLIKEISGQLDNGANAGKHRTKHRLHAKQHQIPYPTEPYRAEFR